MTVGLSPAVANSILDALCRGITWTPPAALYIKLHTGAPGAAGTANAAGNTVRVLAVFGTAASGGSIANTAALAWTNVSTTETYAYWSGWSASSGGVFQLSGTLTGGPVGAGNDYEIGVGGLVVPFVVAS